MELLHSPQDYLYNLHTTNSGEARRLWRKMIREKWDYKCAYCESEEELTLDHVVPQSKGGIDSTKNVVCCCKSCNHSKGQTPWEEWYYQQDFFNEERKKKIDDWMKPESPTNLYTYRPRRNNAS
jgi:5-methylcytosine-specific restriction endonuclease McrA